MGSSKRGNTWLQFCSQFIVVSLHVIYFWRKWSGLLTMMNHWKINLLRALWKSSFHINFKIFLLKIRCCTKHRIKEVSCCSTKNDLFLKSEGMFDKISDMSDKILGSKKRVISPKWQLNYYLRFMYASFRKTCLQKDFVLKAFSSLQFRVYFIFRLLSECHEWSAAPISACLCRGPRAFFAMNADE